MRDIFGEIELDRETVSFIAAGLRELAAVDGVHEAELALIEEFEKGIGVVETPFDLTAEHPLDSPELRELFMRSAILLSMADGEIGELEGLHLGRYASQLDIDVKRLAELYRDVKVFLLSAFEGAEIFRDQAERIGEEMGLEDEDIQTTLQ